MEKVLGPLGYIAVHVLAYAIAYTLLIVAKHNLGWAGVDPTKLFWVYVVAFFAAIFVEGILGKLFPRIWYLTNAFVSRLLLVVVYFLGLDVVSKFKYKYVLDIYLYTIAFIFFILPIVSSMAVIIWIRNRIIRASEKLSQFKRKTMVQGSQSETISSNNQKEVKADKPIVWNFADYGKRVVVGQDHAIETIQKVLIANSKLADLGNPKRQRILASFLFVGPTGVGKTETAKALAVWLEDYGYRYLRIDANQFSDRESVWTLLGSPKGYVGSDKPGLLPYAISQNPKLVLLIDEIEKADQGFYQFLLQMLDEGYVIERSTGGAYYLNRAIVIITSNLENKRIAEIMETIKDPIEIDIAVRKTLEGAKISFGGGRSFRITPEFLSRIDEIIPFRSLGFEDLAEIAYRDLRDLGLNVSYETVYELTQKYYPIAREYGVRYFLKKIQEEVLSR